MEAGEDGVKDTGDLEGLLTTAEEASHFVDTGIDFLAPAFGNVHGSYGGIENIKLDFPRYVLPFRFSPFNTLILLVGCIGLEKRWKAKRCSCCMEPIPSHTRRCKGV